MQNTHNSRSVDKCIRIENDVKLVQTTARSKSSRRSLINRSHENMHNTTGSFHHRSRSSTRKADKRGNRSSTSRQPPTQHSCSQHTLPTKAHILSCSQCLVNSRQNRSYSSQHQRNRSRTSDVARRASLISHKRKCQYQHRGQSKKRTKPFQQAEHRCSEPTCAACYYWTQKIDSYKRKI